MPSETPLPGSTTARGRHRPEASTTAEAGGCLGSQLVTGVVGQLVDPGSVRDRQDVGAGAGAESFGARGAGRGARARTLLRAVAACAARPVRPDGHIRTPKDPASHGTFTGETLRHLENGAPQPEGTGLSSLQSSASRLRARGENDSRALRRTTADTAVPLTWSDQRPPTAVPAPDPPRDAKVDSSILLGGSAPKSLLACDNAGRGLSSCGVDMAPEGGWEPKWEPKSGWLCRSRHVWLGPRTAAGRRQLQHEIMFRRARADAPAWTSHPRGTGSSSHVGQRAFRRISLQLSAAKVWSCAVYRRPLNE